MKQILSKGIIFFNIIMLPLTFANESNSQKIKLSIHLKELTAPEFKLAVEKSKGTCIIPIGVLEKHGPHLPLGTDLIDVREVAERAARQEYSIIYPDYYFSQISEAKHQPGTIAYSSELIWNILQETCDELSRNGIKKIILVNGHGGNNSFLPYFCQSQLFSRRDYAVYLFAPSDNPEITAKANKLKKTPYDSHAGESETSIMITHHPDLVKLNQANTQSGEDLDRMNHLKNVYTGIWWYAKYPNHYAGNGRPANTALGEVLLEGEVSQLVNMIHLVKEDTTVLRLQDQFFKESDNPLETEQ